MKKIFFTVPVLAFLFTSCGGGSCDLSTAESTGKCICSVEKVYEAAREANDESAIADLKEKMRTYKKAINGNIE